MTLNASINNDLTGLPRDENHIPLQGIFRNVASGNATVATAGVPVQLTSTPTEAKSLDITAGSTNTNEVTIGGSGVVGAIIGRKGVPLFPGNTYTFKITDLSQVWVDSIHNGDTVSFNYYW